ncbi:MAG: hypothetical protein AB1938_17995 [Myxococcota bacterium]
MALADSASETTVVTKVTFEASAARAWDTLMFYEEVAAKPPLHLRLLLPVPLRTEGAKERVGDEALCLYQTGSLIKRVTDVEPRRRYCFAVVKQDLDVGGGMRLSGGSYALTELPGGRTEVEAVTRYRSPRRPRWLWTRVEAVVCHLFHRHILREMRRHAEAPRALKDEAPT